MRCKTARDYFCRNRDGMLSETERIRLQEHLTKCPECAEFCGEMEGCMDLLGHIDEMEVPENFEWNLKRRIAMERTRAMRSRASSEMLGWAWGSKFIAAAAATLVIVLAGAWLLAERDSSRLQQGQKIAMEAVKTDLEQQQGQLRFTQTGYPAGIHYVSDDYLGDIPMEETSRQLPFSLASDPRMDYLLRENELLRRQVESLKLQNAYMQRLLYRVRAAENEGKK